MLSTVQLDDHFILKRTKVSDIGAQWLLPSEFNSLELPRTQLAPQSLFGLGLIAP